MDKDVMIVAFKELLDKHGVFGMYIAEWRGEWWGEYDGCLVDWWGEYDCGCWLSSAFSWGMSGMGYDYWCELNKEWLKLLDEYE